MIVIYECVQIWLFEWNQNVFENTWLKLPIGVNHPAIVREIPHFAFLPVFYPGFQKGRVPSEKGTFSAMNGPDRQKGTISAVNWRKMAQLVRWTEEKGHY